MTNSEIATQIRRIIDGELDDCERALKAGDTARALRELDDGVTRLQRLARQLG
jgi:hypothetical protein